MSWIIKDGFITNVDGDGIRIEDPSSGGTISNMTISNVGGSGIVIGGVGDSHKDEEKFDLSRLLDLLESRIYELPEDQQEMVQSTIQNIRNTPNTFNTRRGLKLIHDVAVGVAGSSIGGILASLVS